MIWFLFGGILLCVVLLPVFLAERWCRRHRQKKYFPVPKGMGWLQRTAVWLMYHLPESIQQSDWLKGCAEVAAGKLHPGIRKEAFCQKHKIQKLMVIYGGILAALLFLMMYGWINRVPVLTNNRIQREDARGEIRRVEVEAEIEGVQEKQDLTLTVRPRKYSEEESRALIERVKAYIDEVFPGMNDDLQKVSHDLCFPEKFEDENVTIEWQPENYNLIHQDGKIGQLDVYELPVDTSVMAIIRYDSLAVPYEKKIRIVGKEKSEEEKLADQLKKAVNLSDEQSAGSLQMQLPIEVDGRAVSWQYHQESLLPLLAILAACMIAGLGYYQEERLKKQMQSRTEQLTYDYPGFVHRMVLMLGAGMTVRRSWDQMILDYERKDDEEREKIWLYRELKYTRIQIQNGVPEVQAYMEFGRRTELPQYMKFSQLLFQFIRRGSRGMQEMMLQEAGEAEKQRRDLARRMGETAGTKLLLPMILLLIIVLLIVVVPAFLAM